MVDRPVVLLTDRAWPDDTIERDILAAAGFDLVCGPSGIGSAATIESLATQHQPVAIMTNWSQVTAVAIDSAADLKVVARTGVGLDNIDVPAATRRGILVTNVPDYCLEEVSDHAVGMVLNWTRGLSSADRALRDGAGISDRRLRRLSTLTCGIVGYGRIGGATARKLSGFGCRILAHSRRPVSTSSVVEQVGLGDLLSRSDVVILHIPLTPETQGLIGRRELAVMKPGALLVNVSRGGLIDTAAVAAALASGHLGGAALDVWESEPAYPEALRDFDSVLLTPHTAFASDVSLTELRTAATEEVVRVLRGEPALHPCNLASNGS